jgi:hypothetical protein
MATRVNSLPAILITSSFLDPPVDANPGSVLPSVWRLMPHSYIGHESLRLAVEWEKWVTGVVIDISPLI